MHFSRACSIFLRRLLPALCLSFLLSCASGPPPVEKPPPSGNDPANIGSWSEVLRWPVIAIHSHLLPNGKVLTWQRKDDVLTTETHLWDPETNTFTKVLNPFASVFCSGHTFLTDGTLLVAGGHHFHDGDGEKTLTLFDYRTNEWKKGQDMNAGRWYPTACALADGGTLVVAGSMASGQESAPNRLPQVWKAGGWRDLTQAQQTLDLYPWMLLAPNGKVFMAGPTPRSQFLDTSGAGAWSDGPVNNFGYRDYGSAVMYEPGKVLVVGGGQNPPTATAEIINLNSMFSRWSYTGTMAFARRQMNATLLPDGKVLATGGTSASGFNNATGSVLAAEVWDPATGRWTTLASMSVRRLYHSTAVLLPDGRVLSAGGGMPPSPEGGDANHLQRPDLLAAVSVPRPAARSLLCPREGGIWQGVHREHAGCGEHSPGDLGPVGFRHPRFRSEPAVQPPPVLAGPEKLEDHRALQARGLPARPLPAFHPE